MSADCLFCRLINREVPAKIVHEDEQCVAINDINPQAPIHMLLIPRKHIARLNDAVPEDQALLGHLQLVAAALARFCGVSETGYRVVLNNGSGAGQSVFHLHIHVLGGRGLRWPPG